MRTTATLPPLVPTMTTRLSWNATAPGVSSSAPRSNICTPPEAKLGSSVPSGR
jgi:hypothetical protein